ncbi:MAG: twin-arginine translocation signal domain-containing protein [Hyphomicrobiales bacterium]|nr:twin-arginine translocation signal domain-containing protein [Hyphomicrobiales bacterium]
MNRRRLIKATALAAAATLLGGHTPYGQWVVYRKKHLLIGCHRADPQTYDLAKQIVAVLKERLPKARARVARAPNAGRLASLLGTDQMDVAVLGWADALAMLKGEAAFEPYGPIPLRLIAAVGDRALVAHERFPARHSWLVRAALPPRPFGRSDVRTEAAQIELHPGSQAFVEGKPQPPTD